MEFRCEGLEEHGLRLVPKESTQYAELLAEIRGQVESTSPGFQPAINPFRNPIPERDGDSAAILINGSRWGIAAMRFVWRYYDGADGVLIRSGSIFAGFPLGFPLEYLQTRTERLNLVPPAVAPGGKRYLLSGYALGDNRGLVAAGRHWKYLEYSEIEEHGSAADAARAELSLDGVFFADGGFAGANRYHLWEQVVYGAEEKKGIGELARRRRQAGAAAEEILEEIGARTGPAPGPREHPLRVVPGRDHPEAYRAAARQKIAAQLTVTQGLMGGDFAVQAAMAWAEVSMPFRWMA